jgi:uncharacterized protein (DUF427 family)
VDFAELDYAGALDGFYQDVRTTAGQSYTLTFDLRARPNVATSTQGVEVVWNGQVVATTTPGAAWGSFTVPVTGTGGLDRLTIREVGSQGADGRGALLDNFRLVADSAPAAAQVTVAAAGSVTEGAATGATLTFSLNAAQAEPVTVTYSTANGTAQAGSDFTGRTGATVVIPAGQTSVSVTVPILNDTTSEPNETFSVVLGGATRGSTAIATGGPASVTIVDNDAAPGGTNLLVNGSFEDSAVATGQYAVFQTLPGWTAITGGRIELWNAHNGVVATNGVDFAELDYAGALDGFYQDVRTTAGQSYTLTFDLRARPNVAASTQGVEVVWNGQVVATTTPGAAWGSFTVPVTGTGGLDRLTIREVGSQGADGRGALLDNFRLVADSAPAAAQAAATSDAQAQASAAAMSGGSDGADAIVFKPRLESYESLSQDITDDHAGRALEADPDVTLPSVFWPGDLLPADATSPSLEGPLL